MKPFPPLHAYLTLLIAYVAAVFAAPSVDATPESSLATASPPGSRPTSSGGSVNLVPGCMMDLLANASDP